MGKVKVELNLSGINQLMKSPEIQNALLEAGQAVATAAGEGFEAEVHDTANWIAISNVYPVTPEAYRQNMKENTLLKAVGQVGLPLTKKGARSK